MAAGSRSAPTARTVPLRPSPRPPLASPETKDAGPPRIAPPPAHGAFEGYASLFGVVDLGRDVVMPGAFAESLARRGIRSIRMLWQHDPDQPVGAWTTIAEDETGLYVRGQLNLGVARARELLALMRQGAVDGLSIGFRTVRSRTEPRSGVRHLLRLDLWEVSLVTFPMLPQARVGRLEPPPALDLPSTLRRAARLASAPSRPATSAARSTPTPSPT